jgi:hypothetical protein
MSHPLALASITAVLKDILANGLTNDLAAAGIGDIAITALPPDQISVSGDDRPQLNLFLYHVSQNPNADWWSHNQSHEPSDSPTLRRRFLALDLHYLLTAYGTKDFQSELLLGYAVQLLHNTPQLEQDRISAILTRGQSKNSWGSLSKALTKTKIDELAQQIKTVKLIPDLLSVEDSSKLWSSLQTHYRPSIAYQVSTLLIQSHS